jgi:7-carboxy-7-deazaguanine synthase
MFVRVSGCNLECVYCDTKYSYGEGTEMEIGHIVDQVASAGFRLVEITGGEPLIQLKETNALVTELFKRGYEVLIETNGSVNIRDLDERATVILDIKTPGSGMSDMMDFTNLEVVKNTDEVKFVICSRNDYVWSKDIIAQYELETRCRILLSPAFVSVRPRDLVSWIIEDRLHARLNLQLHKYIFDPGERGV